MSRLARISKVLAFTTMFSPLLIMPAHADPVTIGSAIGLYLFQAGVVTAFTATTAAIIGNIVITAAVVGAQFLLNNTQGGGALDPGQYKSTFNNAEGPAVYSVGRSRLGGLFNFRNTAGLVSYRSVLQCQGEQDAVENYFIGGREVVVDDVSGDVSSPPWSTASGSSLNIRVQHGDGNEVAHPELITEFPTLWSTDHKAVGIAQVFAQFTSPGIANPSYGKLYGSQGVRDKIETVGRRAKIYDPRDGTQVLVDKSTWKWSDNGILCAAHMLHHYPSVAVADIDWADIALEANKADTPTVTRNGNEPRARAWGVWTAEGKTRDAYMRSMLESIDADIFRSDAGLAQIRMLDETPTSDISFPISTLRSLDLSYGPESVERPNVCRVKYYSQERNYELAELPLVEDDGQTPLGWAIIQSEVDAVGEQPFDIDLPFCPSAAQAQRIARRKFHIARGNSGVARFNMAGMAAWGLRVADIPFPDLGVDGDLIQQTYIGTPKVEHSTGSVTIPFVFVPDFPAWVSATDEALPLPVIPEIQFESDIEQPASPSEAFIVQYGSGVFETRVLFALPASGTGAELNFRDYSPALPNQWQGMPTNNLNVGFLNNVNQLGGDIEYRIRASDAGGDLSYFSDEIVYSNLALKNTTPPDPVLTQSQVDISPSEIEYTVVVDTPQGGEHIVSITSNAFPTREVDGFSDETFSAASGSSTFPNWNFTFHTTNGTASATVSTT